MLTPLDEAYALRPSLAHMSSSKGEVDAKGKAAAEDDEDEKPPDPQPVTVSRLLPCIMDVYPILRGHKGSQHLSRSKGSRDSFHSTS